MDDHPSMLDLPPGVRGGDLRPLFESAAFYASSPGKHFLGVVNALVQGGNTPPMAEAVLVRAAGKTAPQ